MGIHIDYYDKQLIHSAGRSLVLILALAAVIAGIFMAQRNIDPVVLGDSTSQLYQSNK